MLTADDRVATRKRFTDNWALDGEPRPQQEEIFDFIAESDSRILLVEAPTGVGKSPVCMTLARSDSGVILTPQKILQDQYRRDWPTVPVIKGRSNYECQKAKALTKGRLRDCDKGSAVCKGASSCPYRAASESFFKSNIGITNYSYFFAILGMGQEDREIKPDWLLFDEGHELESQMIESAAVRVTGEVCNLIEVPFERPDNLEEVLPFMEKVLHGIKKKVEDIRGRIEEGGSALNILDEADLGAMASAMKGVTAREIALQTRLSALAGRINFMLEDIDRGNKWVFSSESETFKGKPLLALGLYNRFVAPMNKRVLITSATIMPPDLMAKWFGWERGAYESLRVDSPFASNNRPVYYKPVAHLSRKNMAEKLPEVVRFIDKILRNYPDKKGVVHCHSFALGEQIAEMSRELPKRMVLHRNTDDREVVLRQHIVSPHPTVLISPSMTEGVDLHDDLARFVIIPKMPYPSLGDPWVRQRMEHDESWYNFQVVRAVVQGCGRAVRHADDWADSYILDGNFERLHTNYFNHFPRWFSKTIVTK